MFGRVEGLRQIFSDGLDFGDVKKIGHKAANWFDEAVFEIKDSLVRSVPAKGTDDPDVLDNAPSPTVKVAGKDQIARIVVDTSKNYLYTYDEKGNPVKAYLIASGKAETPTDKGLRKITHFETYPYKNAPASTVRHKNPDAFGPRLMHLVPVDEKTGKTGNPNGEFIHGNNDKSSLGEYASGGCMRMDNDVVQELVDSGQIPKGAYVLII